MRWLFSWLCVMYAVFGSSRWVTEMVKIFRAWLVWFQDGQSARGGLRQRFLLSSHNHLFKIIHCNGVTKALSRFDYLFNILFRPTMKQTLRITDPLWGEWMAKGKSLNAGTIPMSWRHVLRRINNKCDVRSTDTLIECWALPSSLLQWNMT